MASLELLRSLETGRNHWAAEMSFLNNLKIVWKVALIVAVMGCAMIAVAAFGTRELSATVDGFGELAAAQSSALNLTRAQRRAETYHAALYAVFTEATDAGTANSLKTATKNRDEIRQYLEAAEQDDPARASQIKSIGDQLKAVFAGCDPVLKAGSLASSPEENAKASERAHKECDPVMDAALGRIAQFVGETAQAVAKRKDAINRDARSATWTVIGVSAGGLILGIAIALFIGLNAMSRPIARLKLAMEGLARNDLKTRCLRRTAATRSATWRRRSKSSKPTGSRSSASRLRRSKWRSRPPISASAIWSTLPTALSARSARSSRRWARRPPSSKRRPRRWPPPRSVRRSSPRSSRSPRE